MDNIPIVNPIGNAYTRASYNNMGGPYYVINRNHQWPEISNPKEGPRGILSKEITNKVASPSLRRMQIDIGGSLHILKNSSNFAHIK